MTITYMMGVRLSLLLVGFQMHIKSLTIILTHYKTYLFMLCTLLPLPV